MGTRSKYSLFCLLILITALVSRNYFLQASLPTALWAGFFYFFFRILFLGRLPTQIALFTFLFAVGVECSQLYHSFWADRLREWEWVHYLLGNTFDWKDIVYYALGIIPAWLLDEFFLV